MDVTEIRRLTPATENYAYFQTSGFSPKPEPVIEEVVRWTRYINQGPALPEVYARSIQAFEATRARVAQSVNAHPDEIVLGENATIGINIIANGINWAEGDNVVLSTHEHPGNRIPWYNLIRRYGVELRFLPIDNDPDKMLEELPRLINSRTKLVRLSHVSRRTGVRLPAAELTAITHELGVPILFDGAQSYGAIPVDVAAIGCDFYTFSGHKYIMAPQGTGGFFVRHDRIEWVQPSWIGSHSQKDFDEAGGLTLLDEAKRFEFGTRNLADQIGFGKALDMWSEIGWENVFHTFVYFRRLVQDAIQTSTQSLDSNYVRPMDRNSVETAEQIASALHHHNVDDAQRAMRAHLLIERPSEQARLVLFLDEEAITERHGLTLRLMPAHKFPHNPILAAQYPWEGESVAPSATVLHDADQMLYQLWYHGSRQLSPREQLSSLCFATSMDGVHWTKPKLGVSAYEGFPENNLVMPWGDPRHDDVLSATIMAKSTGIASTHYEMVYLTTGVHPSGVWHASSPDGIHWQSVPEQPVDIGGAIPVGDALYCMAEPEADRFAVYYRLPLRVSAQATIGRMDSHDLRHWGGHRAVLSTDDQDPADAELYGLTPFRYGSLTLAILWIHRRATNTGELQMASSRDGIGWTRLGDRQPLLCSGEPGSFDHHGLTHATIPIVVGNELWFYYAGARQPLNSGQPMHQIGLATLSLDRFIALEAGQAEGWATTQPLDCSIQSRLLLNAVVNPGGYVLVEALSEEGLPIPGFTRAEALPVEGNVIYHRVAWREHEDLSALAGQRICLRYYCCRASLYAFRLAHPEASISDLLAGIC